VTTGDRTGGGDGAARGGRSGGDPPTLERLVSVPSRRPGSERPAPDVDGVDWSGAPCRLRLLTTGPPWLLLFLGSRCDGCHPFWSAASRTETLGLGPEEAVAIVTRPPPLEDPVGLRALVPAAGVTLLLSDTAWTDYRVQGPPFFTLVDAGRVVTEGVAWSVEYVAAEVSRARRRTLERKVAAPGGGPIE
jgi:hypothetical protein